VDGRDRPGAVWRVSPVQRAALDRLLTERLRELEREHIVSRVVMSGPPVRVQYSLTERGIELEPIIRALGEWAEVHVSAPAEDASGKRRVARAR
jgi:DNA-binding HxlR family transcriptional regulator